MGLHVNKNLNMFLDKNVGISLIKRINEAITGQ